MACLKGSKVSSKDQVLQNEFAEMSREQFEDFKARYGDLQDELTEQSLDSSYITDSRARAGTVARDQFGSARAMSDRRLEAYNVELTQDQREARDRAMARDETAGVADTENRATIASADRQDALRADLVGIGQGIRQQSISELGSAAGIENQRGAQNAQNRTAARSGLLQSAAQAGSMFALMSSKDAKRNIRPADTSQDLRTIRKLDLKGYQYKDGMGDPGQRRGVIAEDTPAPMSTGRTVDLGDTLFTLAGAVQEMDRKMRRLERRAA